VGERGHQRESAGAWEAWPYCSKLIIDRMAPGIENRTPFQSKMMRGLSRIPEQAGARALPPADTHHRTAFFRETREIRAWWFCFFPARILSHTGSAFSLVPKTGGGAMRS
jgi:hypothetical protein